jgi:hypothetical protein
VGVRAIQVSSYGEYTPGNMVVFGTRLYTVYGDDYLLCIGTMAKVYSGLYS